MTAANGTVQVESDGVRKWRQRNTVLFFRVLYEPILVWKMQYCIISFFSKAFANLKFDRLIVRDKKQCTGRV